MPLPCEWNWQLCLSWYARPRTSAYHDHNGLCGEPPKLLHANCGVKPALAALDISRAPEATARNVERLDRALRSSHDCARAAQLRPWLGVERTACNATFLLQRALVQVQ